MRTWPPMNDEERAVLSLPPRMQTRMATLALMGWTFKFYDGVTTNSWIASRPFDDFKPYPAAGHTIRRSTLLGLLEDMVGYDVLPTEGSSS